MKTIAIFVLIVLMLLFLFAVVVLYFCRFAIFRKKESRKPQKEKPHKETDFERMYLSRIKKRNTVVQRSKT